MTNRKLQKQNIVIIAVLIIAVSAVLVFFIPQARAELFGLDHSTIDGVYKYVIDSGISDMVLISDLVNGAINYVMTDLYAFMQGIGIVIVVLYVMVTLIREVSQGHYDLNMWLRWFITAAVGALLIIFTPDIMNAIESLGRAFVKYVGVSFQDGVDTLAREDSFSSDQTLRVFVICFMVAFIKLTKYTLAMEIIIRRTFFPIAMASLVAEGKRSPGFRYIKKLLSVYVRMALFIACVVIATFMSTDIINFIPICLAGLVMMSRMGEIADQALGV